MPSFRLSLFFSRVSKKLAATAALGTHSEHNNWRHCATKSEVLIRIETTTSLSHRKAIRGKYNSDFAWIALKNNEDASRNHSRNNENGRLYNSRRSQICIGEPFFVVVGVSKKPAKYLTKRCGISPHYLTATACRWFPWADASTVFIHPIACQSGT